MNKCKPMNLIFIISDEHNRKMTGCYGSPVVRTPNLDTLAKNGVKFNNAYCNCPICVPSRASMTTGEYAHKNNYWDNAHPYAGDVKGFGHRLVENGHTVITIGKLHYKNDDPHTGFPDQRLPLNVVDGIGDIPGCIRTEESPNLALGSFIKEAHWGDSSYQRFDKAVAKEAVNFLKNEAKSLEKPWVLYIGFANPHFPFIADEKYKGLYPLDKVIMPKQYTKSERPMHKAIQFTRKQMGMEEGFDENSIRKALAVYYGMCSFLDEQVGKIINTLKEIGLDQKTRIIYTSDHGEMAGEHGLLQKYVLYEESVAVPLIISGPDISKGKVIKNNVSLIDIYPTILNNVGINLSKTEKKFPGISLLPIARGELNVNRTVFSEYHAALSITGSFMIRNDRYKYIYFTEGYPCQLFDLKKDPYELNDLSDKKEYQFIIEELHKELFKICDPDELNRRAKQDQSNLIKKYGSKEEVIKKFKKIPYSPAPVQ
jgi:choline-sulfatase